MRSFRTLGVTEASLALGLLLILLLGLLSRVAVLSAEAKAAADAVVDELVLLLAHLVSGESRGRGAVTTEGEGRSVGILALNSLLGRLR